VRFPKIGEGKMRKTLAKLDDAERYQLLYLADLGTALCMSGLFVNSLYFVGNLFSA
jgi:hypothetical protein